MLSSCCSLSSACKASRLSGGFDPVRPGGALLATAALVVDDGLIGAAAARASGGGFFAARKVTEECFMGAKGTAATASPLSDLVFFEGSG